MIFRMTTLLTILAALVLGAGCSQDPQLTSPDEHNGAGIKNGTEVLGPPSIPIASGTGFAEGGVGMVGVDTGELMIEVPAESQVAQALLYWAGGATIGIGDDEISLDGTLIQGELIGGPVAFFGNYEFFAYRADITNLGLVGAGTNTFTVADFDFTGSTVDENNGASILVIYDDGTSATITLRDGLDMAYFGFEPTLDATVPQVFSVDPADVGREAELVMIAASVGENRPSVIKVSTSEGDQLFDDVLGSFDGLTWDSLILTVDVPAGVDELSVQVISFDDEELQGASLGWVTAGLALQPADVDTYVISGSVFVDADDDGEFGTLESGIGEVVVELLDGDGLVATAMTDFDGHYMFSAPAGAYTLNINLDDYPDDFNATLATSFDPATALSLPVTIGPDSPANDFGFKPLAEQLTMELENGDLTSDGLPVQIWTKLFRRALIEEQSERQPDGHGGDHGQGGGWGHGENYFNGEELLEFTGLIEGLYLVDPYQFTDGEELREVYDILKNRPTNDEERLFRELLVTQLNFVAGLGIIEQADLVGVLISWGETLLASGDEAKDKSRQGDITFAYELFEAMNTGGGGDVDE
jgi:hypothetical protein